MALTKLNLLVVLICGFLCLRPTSVNSVSSSLMQSLPQRRINRHFNGDIFVEQGKNLYSYFISDIFL